MPDMALHGLPVSDALESAANCVQRFILKICEDSDLYYKLKYDPYQPGQFLLCDKSDFVVSFDVVC